MVVVDKEQKAAVMIGVTIPADSHIRKKEYEKTEVPGAEGTTGADEESEVQSGPRRDQVRYCAEPVKLPGPQLRI